jgi:7-cyano-7-deazaguanine synthase
MSTIVLLSGGMDSTVSLYWAVEFCSPPIHCITFAYGQNAVQTEIKAAQRIFRHLNEGPHRSRMGYHRIVPLTHDLLVAKSSILGDSPVQQYSSVEEAIAGTPTDKSFIPLRNALMITIAAHHLLAEDEQGGNIVLGIRGRVDRKPPGFPDCTHVFALAMQDALRIGSRAKINVVDPLNIHAPSRAQTIELATMLDGCLDALQFTTSCYRGMVPPCGKCLPCLRRAQAFAEVAMSDPALVREERL